MIMIGEDESVSAVSYVVVMQLWAMVWCGVVCCVVLTCAVVAKNWHCVDLCY
jgi:hypothetical protein